MPTNGPTSGLRRTTGALFVLGALSFAVAATVLSSTFEWPDVLRVAGTQRRGSSRRRLSSACPAPTLAGIDVEELDTYRTAPTPQGTAAR